MRIAVIGSRNLQLAIDRFIPDETTEIISGGARGIDTCAYMYAKKHHIPFYVFPPMYEMYGKAAPLIRDKQIVQNCDMVIAIWDGVSKGTKFTIDYARKMNKRLKLYILH